MEWSANKIMRERPKRLDSNFTINDSLDVFVIPPSRNATIILKDTTDPNASIYQSSFPLPVVSEVTIPDKMSENDYLVSYTGNAAISNRNISQKNYNGKSIRKRNYSHKYNRNQYEEADSLNSSFGCISLPDESIFDNRNTQSLNNYYSSYKPINRGNFSYLNRSIYLPTPKVIQTPKSERRSIYLPAPKKEESNLNYNRNSSKSNNFNNFQRSSFHNQLYAHNATDSDESSSGDNFPRVYKGRKYNSSSDSYDQSSLTSGDSMRNTLRENAEIDWNNNLADIGNETDDELNNDRNIIRSYVPFKEKKHEKPKTDFSTEIIYREKMISLEEIMKLDLELISELAKARAQLPKKSNNYINFF